MEYHTHTPKPKELDAEPATEVLRFHLPPGVRYRFKLACLKEGRTMSETLREFIDTYTDESEQNTK